MKRGSHILIDCQHHPAAYACERFCYFLGKVLVDVQPEEDPEVVAGLVAAAIRDFEAGKQRVWLPGDPEQR